MVSDAIVEFGRQLIFSYELADALIHIEFDWLRRHGTKNDRTGICDAYKQRLGAINSQLVKNCLGDGDLTILLEFYEHHALKLPDSRTLVAVAPNRFVPSSASLLLRIREARSLTQQRL